jgi:uncharacterized protein (TIGR00297 family)
VTLAIAASLGAGLAALAYVLGWLTRSGALAAAVVGAAVLYGTALGGATMLALFVVTGSLLTRWTERRVAHRVAAGRTARQVIANGAWAAVGALIARSYPQPGWAILTGALASAQADTWATEIGAAAKGPPRLITTWRPVSPGTSGGVTGIGTTAGVIGGSAIALLAVALGSPWQVAAAGLTGGTAGMMIDSLLGATVQGRFHCTACDSPTEQAIHDCGRHAETTRGWRWLDNDAVNLVANGAGAAIALLLCFCL